MRKNKLVKVEEIEGLEVFVVCGDEELEEVNEGPAVSETQVPESRSKKNSVNSNMFGLRRMSLEGAPEGEEGG